VLEKVVLSDIDSEVDGSTKATMFVSFSSPHMRKLLGASA
jgi:hypothetical protein